MGVVNTTNVIDNSMFLKAVLPMNMVGDNYYIENLQDKRDSEWEYRYNRVGIEEELSKQIAYTNSDPEYTPIEVVINNVKSETGEDLGTDWASLSFKDLKHYNNLGSRYRFSLDFPDMSQMTEDDKHYKTSIWICVNKSPIHAGNSCTVRRCNTAVALLGYENRDRRKTTTREVHWEPVILDNSQLKYMSVYSNQTVPIPQAEWYAILQLNYFTNSIKINDRFIFGTLDNEVRDNNSVYKVKAVIKSNMTTTFTNYDSNSNADLETTPTIILGLDKDEINPHDNFKTGIANSAPVYLIPDQNTSVTEEVTESEVEPESKAEETIGEYILKDVDEAILNIPMGDFQSYKLKLYHDDNEITDFNKSDITYSYELTKKSEAVWNKYFNFSENSEGIGFTINNIKTCMGSVLKVTVTYKIPNTDDKTVEKEFDITLGKAY